MVSHYYHTDEDGNPDFSRPVSEEVEAGPVCDRGRRVYRPRPSLGPTLGRQHGLPRFGDAPGPGPSGLTPHC